MKFGVSPSPFYWWRNVEEFNQWISESESGGYDGIFIPDHYMITVPEHGPCQELLDAWSVLSYIAARTRSIKIGSCVSPIPRWIPSQLAKVISIVDLLSEGRVIAGFGAGIFPEEFINYSPYWRMDEPKIRAEKFLEGLKVIVKLWKEDSVTFEGKYYKLSDAVLLPKPKQKPHPPLWSGGLGPNMQKIAAKYCDAWLSHTAPFATPTPEKYEEGVNRIKKYLKEYDRNLDKFTFGLFHHISENMSENASVVEKFAKVGCQYFIINMPVSKTPIYNGKWIELTRKFAKEVIPSF
jgi:alkanesulfonate monooxygenase SsuD/methylene tetrahydromethanopterin reductase-like flavin-dependent oxidoreductase (luciferase family)